MRKLYMVLLCCLPNLLWLHPGIAQDFAYMPPQTLSPSHENDRKELRAVLVSLERKFGVYFTFESRIVQDKYIPGEVTITNDLEETLKKLLNPLDLKFKKLSDKYYTIYPLAEEQGEGEEAKAGQGLQSMDSEGVRYLYQHPDKITFPFHVFSITISGAVTDENNQPLPGVNVIEKGTTNGTTTDASGKYTLNVQDEKSVLIFTFIGYTSEEVVANGRSTVNISLTPGLQSLQEVVVIGYGTQRKEDLTGSISQLSAEELDAYPAFNVSQAFKGRAPGVMVTQNSGRPGGTISVRIRGDNSIIGNNEPLYVVDGFPITGGIDYLNPSDIESISILKDASATAIYGSRGANGVIIITSKQGRKNTAGRIEVNSYYGMQSEINRYEMLNAQQYAIVANEWLKNEGQEPYWDASEVEALGEGTDWWGENIKPAMIHNHVLTFSGGGENTAYSLALNYFDQPGLVLNTAARRGNVRLNINHDVNERVKVGLNLIMSRSEVFEIPFDNQQFLEGFLSAPPTVPVYDENGVPTRIESVYYFSYPNITNPAMYAEPYKDRTLKNFINANVNLEFKITEALKFGTRVGLEYLNGHNERYAPKDLYSTGEEGDDGYAADNFSYSNSVLIENTLRYLKTFNDKHKFDVVGGMTYQSYMDRNVSLSGNKLSTDITQNFDWSSVGLIRTPSSGITEWKLLSGLGRINYSFDGKYLVTGSLRADGSSRFGASNKWGYFPSAAFAWNLSEESFLSDVDFISSLKFRASYGVTGSTALSSYQSLNRLNAVLAVYQTNTEAVGYAPENVGNKDLRWEKTGQFNVGIDLSIWEGVLSLNLDYYRKLTTDLLSSVPIPLSTGFGSVLRNIGEMENKGIEMGLSADVLRKEVKWEVIAQASANQNTVLKLAGGSDIMGPSFGHPYNSSLNLTREGEPFGVFVGLQEDGLNDDGSIKYVDVNSDGVINAADRVILGDPNPKWIFSLNNNLSYKNFGLNIFMEGIQGRDIFWATAGTHLNSFQRGHNQFAELFGNYWTPENPNPNAKYPKVASSSASEISERYVKDGSYLRLKVVTLSYNLPVSNLRWINAAQLYVSGTNLFTLTNYPGLDPEVNTRGNAMFRGVDQDSYPSAKMLTVGTKLVF